MILFVCLLVLSWFPLKLGCEPHRAGSVLCPSQPHRLPTMTLVTGSPAETAAGPYLLEPHECFYLENIKLFVFRS